MKCTNCGKNIACCHYKYTVNGVTSEAHLCSECASLLGEDQSFFGLGRIHSASFDSLDRLFDEFFRPFSLVPAFAGAVPEKAEPRPAVSAPKEASFGVDPELSRRREINALKAEMLNAAHAEDYERAAELRDRLRELGN